VENPGIVSFVDERTPGFPTNIYHLNKIQNTKTNERTPGFPTNIYHLNKIQNTTTNETIPGFSQGLFHLFLSFIEMIYVCGKPRGCCVLYFVEMIYACGKPRCSHKHISSQQNTKTNE
jgi:hypothetical protein